MKCKICNKDIHPKRIELGYVETCVEHSNTERYTGRITETDIETYEIQVIRDPKVAKELRRLEMAYR